MFQGKSPIIKGKGFCPDPVVKFGIPKFADSRYNPNVIGTPDWMKYWDEQLYYILHGYNTGGVFLPGRYYYFLNFKKFETRRGIVDATYCDLHLDIAYFIEHCKKHMKNGIIAKKRRAGVSEAFITMGADYGFRFIPGYKVGVAGGLSNYVDDFMKKWAMHDSIIVPELRVRHKGSDDRIACYDVIDSGGKRQEGTFNAIYPRSMFQNANLFKGLGLDDVFAEEGVEFKKLKEFFDATKACFMDGSIQLGNFFTWGTGGNRSSNGDDFEHMWHNHDLYNMERLFTKGTRFYSPFYGGALNKSGVDISVVPNLKSKFKEYQIIGMEDEEAAEIDILAKREKYLASGEVQEYIGFCQDNPLTIEEVFKKVSSNKFNIEKLNKQGFEISSNRKRWAKYKLEYVRDKDGVRVIPYKVEAIPAKAIDKDEDCVWITDDGMPAGDYANIYSAGADSYDQDQSKTSKSLGAMLVLIRDHNYANKPKMKPVCAIRTRPARKEIFYDMCLKVAVFYNLVGDVLVDVAKPMIMDHFKKEGGARFLARRPLKFESVNSEQQHEYGVSLNQYSRPLMVSVMQSYIEDHSDKIMFDKLINELKDYDETAKDSDNDLADALGIALMHHLSDGVKPKDFGNINKNDTFRFDSPGSDAPRFDPTNIEKDIW